MPRDGLSTWSLKKQVLHQTQGGPFQSQRIVHLVLRKIRLSDDEDILSLGIMLDMEGSVVVNGSYRYLCQIVAG